MVRAGSALHRWVRSNLRGQRQEGYVVATIALPLGDITATQLRRLADIVRRFTKDTIRTTVEQNFVLRWISQADVPELYEALDAAGLAEPGVSNVFDIVACPGTDTCKLGISSSRGLAAELRHQLVARSVELEQAIEDLHIKISGCFNSCGQHHVADIGFYGVSRTVGGFKVPHFQVVLGGQWEENAGSYGLPIVAVPSKRVPQALDLITGYYMENRSGDERFPAFVVRMGKAAIRQLLDEVTKDPPEHEAEPEFYSDWGDPRQYSLGDIGKGECAGEVVTQFEFEIGAAERTVFESQLQLENGQHQEAGAGAYLAMVKAAKALVQLQYDDVTENDVDEIVEEFKERYYDNEAIFDPFAGPKFADYFLAAHGQGERTHSLDSAHTLIEEAHLFLEAVHSCYNKIRSEGLSALGAST